MKNILRPTRILLICDALFSLGFILAVIFIPWLGFSGTFAGFTVGRKILSVVLSWVFGCIVYYPFVAGVVYLARSAKHSAYRTKEIVYAVLFIALLNPVTISLLVSKTVIRNSVLPAGTSTCGFRVNEILANSNMGTAGIQAGDVIMTMNGTAVTSVQDILMQLETRRPGDTVVVGTDKGVRTVELARDTNDPSRPVLGVKLEPNVCGN